MRACGRMWEDQSGDGRAGRRAVWCVGADQSRVISDTGPTAHRTRAEWAATLPPSLSRVICLLSFISGLCAFLFLFVFTLCVYSLSRHTPAWRLQNFSFRQITRNFLRKSDIHLIS